MLAPDQRPEQLIEIDRSKCSSGDALRTAENLEQALRPIPTDVNLRLEIARQKRTLGQYDQAAMMLDDILDQQPQYTEALIERGQLLHQTGDHRGAAEAFRAAAAVAPERVGIRLELARQLRLLGRLDDAETLIDNLIESDPKLFGAQVERGHVRRGRGDHAGAALAFEAAATIDPEHIPLRLEWIRALRAIDRDAEAEVLVDNVLARDSSNIGALIERGHLRRKFRDHAAAAAAFEGASKLAHGQLGLRLEWVRELRMLDRLDEAETILEEILAQDNRHFGALVERGHLRRKRGDRAGAAEAFAAAAAIEPAHAGLRLEQVRELRALSRLEEADRMLDGLLAENPRLTGALVERGHARRSEADHTRAAEAFRQALALEPSNVGLALELVRELRSLNLHDEAGQLLRGLLARRDITSSAAAFGLAYLFIELRWWTEAEALLLAMHQAAPSDSAVLLALSQLARKKGNQPASLRYLRQAAQHDPTSIPMRLRRAAELAAHGLYLEAQQELQIVITSHATNYSAWRQLGFLHRATGDLQQSEATFETALALDPLNIEALVDLAQTKLALGNLPAAHALLDQALALDPNHFVALIAAAEGAMAEEDLRVAADFADRARTLHPQQLGAYLLSARIADETLNYREADEILHAASARFGSQPSITATQIFLLRQQRQHHTARLLAASAVEREMPFALWTECAALANTLGNFALTEKILEHAMTESAAERARVHFFRAQAAEGRRDYNAAIAFYRSALQLNPRIGGWHSELARCHLLLADTVQAKSDLQRSITLDAGARRAKRQSLNLSQHHVGQLLDEFQLDRSVLAQLQAIVPLPAEQQIAPLKRLILANPDNTAPAILLMIAARRDGLFDQDVHSSDARIPRRIVQYWDSEEVPPDIAVLMQSWRTQNPNYDYVLFNDVSARRFLQDRTSPEIVRAFELVKHPAQRADLFRLAYLAQEGGFYVDADDRCLGNIGLLYSDDASLAVYQENYGTVANNFLGASRNHPVIVRALELAVEAMLRGDHDIVWLSTGPGLLTRAFTQVLAATGTLLDSTIVRELGEMQRFVGLHCPALYKRTHQHWSRAAFSRRTRQ
jgi:tetratricopeptide (TPR) repeat protein